MSLIIGFTGTRTLEDTNLIYIAFAESPWSKMQIHEVVEGGARGIDAAARKFAIELGLKPKTFEAKWDDLTVPNCKIITRKNGIKYNLLAGFNRNQEMIDYLSFKKLEGNDVGLIGIRSFRAKNKGTNDCILRAYYANIETYVREF